MRIAPVQLDELYVYMRLCWRVRFGIPVGPVQSPLSRFFFVEGIEADAVTLRLRKRRKVDVL